MAIGTVVVMLIAVLWLASVIIRNIKIAVVDVNRTLIALSTRDLTARTRYTGKDEFGEISRNLDNMAQQISEVIREIGSATAQVATAAEQSSAVALQTSQNVAQQRQGTDQGRGAQHHRRIGHVATRQRQHDAGQNRDRQHRHPDQRPLGAGRTDVADH